MEYGWEDWWQISITSRPCRVLCTLGGGVALAFFTLSGASQVATGRLFSVALVALGGILLGALWRDVKLAWSWLEFMDENRTMMIVYWFASMALALLAAWHWGEPIVTSLAWHVAIPAALGILVAAFLGGTILVLTIVGPSRVSAVCGAASFVLSAWAQGQWFPTKLEVWGLLFGLLEIENDAVLWAWTIILGAAFLIDRGGDLPDLA